jgi:hypothetical protein
MRLTVLLPITIRVICIKTSGFTFIKGISGVERVAEERFSETILQYPVEYDVGYCAN